MVWRGRKQEYFVDFFLFFYLFSHFLSRLLSQGPFVNVFMPVFIFYFLYYQIWFSLAYRRVQPLSEPPESCKMTFVMKEGFLRCLPVYRLIRRFLVWLSWRPVVSVTGIGGETERPTTRQWQEQTRKEKTSHTPDATGWKLASESVDLLKIHALTRARLRGWSDGRLFDGVALMCERLMFSNRWRSFCGSDACLNITSSLIEPISSSMLATKAVASVTTNAEDELPWRQAYKGRSLECHGQWVQMPASKCWTCTFVNGVSHIPEILILLRISPSIW